MAEGVQFSSGRCVVSWRTSAASIGIYDDIDRVIAVHGHSGDTELVWIDPLMNTEA